MIFSCPPPAPRKKASDYAIGESVILSVGGAAKQFIVVHQGKPGTMYDESCNGTWLLMKDCYEKRQWHSSDENNYSASTINRYLNGTFLNLFKENIKPAIKQVKLPYRPGAGSSSGVLSGSSGLSSRIFLLSAAEVDFGTHYKPDEEGAELAYFKGCSNNKRVAYLDGSAAVWWLRSPYCDRDMGESGVLVVKADGNWGWNQCSTQSALRPALVLNSESLFLLDTNEFIGM